MEYVPQPTNLVLLPLMGQAVLKGNSWRAGRLPGEITKSQDQDRSH